MLTLSFQIANVYTVDCIERYRYKLKLRGVQRQVDFNKPFDTCKLPDAERILILPDRRILALHATCARVAHLSGAAEFLDQLAFDIEETQVLLEDGSSAELLDAMLGPFTSFSNAIP